MSDHIIPLTPDEELAFEAKVAKLLALSQMDPPPFPPVVPVADVTALMISQFQPIIAMEVQEYLAQ
jgi:hypothetical protein